MKQPHFPNNQTRSTHSILETTNAIKTNFDNLRDKKSRNFNLLLIDVQSRFMSSEWNTRAKSYRLQKKQLKKKDCNAVSNEIVTW